MLGLLSDTAGVDNYQFINPGKLVKQTETFILIYFTTEIDQFPQWILFFAFHLFVDIEDIAQGNLIRCRFGYFFFPDWRFMELFFTEDYPP